MGASCSPRPYWHLDAKWLAGIGLFLLLQAALLAADVAAATSKDTAVTAVGSALAVAFSPEGLDDPAGIDEIKKRMGPRAGEVRPIPAFDVTMSRREISTLSPRELRLRFFGKMAERLWEGGPEGLGATVEDPKARARIVEEAGALGFMSRGTHEQARRAAWSLAGAAFLAALPLVFFSRRFGRLGSLGVALSVAAAPGALTLTFARLALADPPSPQSGPGATGISSIIGAALPPIVARASSVHVQAAVAGSLLVLAALSGGVIWRLRARSIAARDPVPSDGPA